MLTPLQEIEQRTITALRRALDLEADPLVAPSQNPQFGDYQSNAAMQLAGRLKKERGEKANPRQIAEQIVAKLEADDLLAGPPSIAGPGFINFVLSPAYVSGACTRALADARLGIPTVEEPQRVVVEYSSPNIAKQMHVGHIRSTILGDCAARVLEFLGHDVIRQNHVGDWGTQFGRVLLALWYRAAAEHLGRADRLESLVERMEAAMSGGDESARRTVIAELAAFHQEAIEADPEGTVFFEQYVQSMPLDLDSLERMYRFASAATDTPLASEVSVTHPSYGTMTLRDVPRLVVTFIQGTQGVFSDSQEQTAWRRVVDLTMQVAQAMYDRFGIELKPSDTRGESFYNQRLPSLTQELLDSGVAEQSEGAAVSFAGGHKAPLMIRKSGGGFGYGTTDLAAAEFRARQLKADRVIYFVDFRQSQHFQQVFATYRAAVERAGWPGDVRFEHASFGTILGEDGRPLRTRAGENVKLADLLDEAERRARAVVDSQSAELPEDEKARLARDVGIGAVKYADLSKDRTSDYVFSYDQMLSLDGNTAPYLQYAHARVCSIQRKAREQGLELSDQVTVLSEPAELALAKHLLSFGDVVRNVAQELKPHVLCTFLYEAARRFSAFYENCPVLRSGGEVRSSRLALTALTGRTLELGLDLLGIAHPDRM